MTAAHMRRDAPASRSCLHRQSACAWRSTLRCQLRGAARTARPGRCLGCMCAAAKALRPSPPRRAPRQLHPQQRMLLGKQRMLLGKHGRRPHAAASRLRRHPPRACGATPAFSGPRRSTGAAVQLTYTIAHARERCMLTYCAAGTRTGCNARWLHGAAGRCLLCCCAATTPAQRCRHCSRLALARWYASWPLMRCP